MQSLPGVGSDLDPDPDLDLSQAGQGIFSRHRPVNTVHHLHVCPVQSGKRGAAR